MLCGIKLPTVEPGHFQVQKDCGEDPGDSFQDSQGLSLTQGLQEGVKGDGLVQPDKEKSKSNLTVYYIYSKVVTRITEPHNRSKKGATGRSCALEGLYQEIPGEGWCSPGKGQWGGGGSSSLKPFKTQEDKVTANMT